MNVFTFTMSRGRGTDKFDMSTEMGRKAATRAAYLSGSTKLMHEVDRAKRAAVTALLRGVS